MSVQVPLPSPAMPVRSRLKVQATIEDIKPNRCGRARVTARGSHHQAGLHAYPGQLIAIEAKHMRDFSVGTKVVCHIAPNKGGGRPGGGGGGGGGRPTANREDWVAISARKRVSEKSQLRWEPWQMQMGGFELPNTQPGATHLGEDGGMYERGR